MDSTERAHDSGTGYTAPPSSYDATLTEVGRGKPMGEFLRRYWHPVGLAGDASSAPKAVRILGEDLVLFRDGMGRPGLVKARCAHRGTTLYYGRVEKRGIRCCYHGWLFDVEGRCLEQPCEPGGGRFRDRIRQPWYPVQERYGLIFAFMGPLEKKPVLPRYEALEVLEPGEFIEADDSSVGGGGSAIIPCNWLQHYENLVDPFHVPILHGNFSGTQFVEQMGLFPAVRWEYADWGVRTLSERKLPDGRIFLRVSGAALPNLRVIPNPRVAQYARVEMIGWVLPIDDTSFRIYNAARVREAGAIRRQRSTRNGKSWEELTSEERREYPGDFEAQTGQGPITFHSDEHLATSDKGVAMLRRLLKRQVKVVAEGKDPAGVSFDEDAPPVAFEAGNFIREP